MARILTEAFDGLIGGRIVSVPAGTELSDANDGAAILAAGAATFEFTEASRVAVEAQVAAWRAVVGTKRDVKLISFVSQTVAQNYAYSGVAAPALTFSADGTGSIAGSAGAGSLGVSRVGSGAGVPSAGDTVRVGGSIDAADLVDGETCTFALPFAAGTAVYPRATVTVLAGSDITATIALPTASTARITFGVTGDDAGQVTFDIEYQAAS